MEKSKTQKKLTKQGMSCSLVTSTGIYIYTTKIYTNLRLTSKHLVNGQPPHLPLLKLCRMHYNNRGDIPLQISSWIFLNAH